MSNVGNETADRFPGLVAPKCPHGLHQKRFVLQADGVSICRVTISRFPGRFDYSIRQLKNSISNLTFFLSIKGMFVHSLNGDLVLSSQRVRGALRQRDPEMLGFSWR